MQHMALPWHCHSFSSQALPAGAPAFYINRTEKDQERLEELRALNRETFAQTGEYMSEVRLPFKNALSARILRFGVSPACLAVLSFTHVFPSYPFFQIML